MPALPTLTAFAASPPPWSLASLDTNFTNVATLLKSANNYSLYLADAGAVNAYAATFAAGVTWTLAAGAQVTINPANTNTTASTLAINSGTAKNIFHRGVALVGGEIRVGVPFTAVYDGTQYNLIGPAVNVVKGTVTNDSAAAGLVGEAIVSLASAVSFPSTTTYGDACSIVLTAGDWDLTGQGIMNVNGATVVLWNLGISATTGNSTTGLVSGDSWYSSMTPPSGAGNFAACIANWRVSIAAGGTYYLKFAATFSVATPQFNGRLSARRVR